jgi:hypothetical protein
MARRALKNRLGLIVASFIAFPMSVVCANPATNTGGIALHASAFPFIPYVVFGQDSVINGNTITANFGATPFVGTVPDGFQNWPSGGHQ